MIETSPSVPGHKEEERTYVYKRIPAAADGKGIVTCENLYTTEITCINIPTWIVTGMSVIN